MLGVLRELVLERLISRERCRERELAVAMLCQLVIGPCSKLSMTRRFQQTTLADELSLGAVTAPELLAAMDWLLKLTASSGSRKRSLAGACQTAGSCSTTCPRAT